MNTTYSKELERLMNNLESNWMLIEAFLQNPKEICQKFNVVGLEAEALCSQNIGALANLGVNPQYAEIVMSGTHRGGIIYQGDMNYYC